MHTKREANEFCFRTYVRFIIMHDDKHVSVIEVCVLFLIVTFFGFGS